ncbi:hypothetical protein E2320_006796 [Naja naja]|nr:hypothetical protein E2320_006796 [Naja naja]
MDPVGPFGRFAVVHDVGDEVVDRVLVHSLHLLTEVFPEVHVPTAGKLPLRLRGPHLPPPAKAHRPSGEGASGGQALLGWGNREGLCHSAFPHGSPKLLGDFSPLQQHAGLKPGAGEAISPLKVLEAGWAHCSPAPWPPLQRSLGGAWALCWPLSCPFRPSGLICVAPSLALTCPFKPQHRPPALAKAEQLLPGRGRTYVMGKLTMVGFFSTKKLFLVNLLMQKIRLRQNSTMSQISKAPGLPQRHLKGLGRPEGL